MGGRLGRKARHSLFSRGRARSIALFVGGKPHGQRLSPALTAAFRGLGLGELFVARNAGNMVDTATMGTIEYGAEHLGVPLM